MFFDTFGFPEIVQDPALDQLISVANSLVSAAQATFQRRMLVLSGDAQRMGKFAELILSRVCHSAGEIPHAPLWVGGLPGGAVDTPRHMKCLSMSMAFKLLGDEHRFIVFDAWAGFNPDAFCAVMGTLVGGGLLICITPPLHAWQHDPDYQRMVPHGYAVDSASTYFLSRIADGFHQGGAITLWDDNAHRLLPPPQDAMKVAHDSQALPGPVQDQSLALRDQNALLDRLKAMLTEEPFTCVITADRGRGKTALLGRLAAHWLSRSSLNIIVTCSMPTAAHSVLAWAKKEFAVITGTSPGGAAQLPTFMAPDALLQCEQTIDVVFVDEAAMLPISVLQQLIARFPRVVLASTVHGYEGSGRGLALKLFPWLDRARPGWWCQQMSTPIRWADDDPLEHWLGEVFCLNDDVPEITDALAPWRVRQVSGKTLYDTPELLHAVFGLLVSAHYRTTPSDLRDLLDGPNLHLWVLEIGNRVAGVCLVALEGPFVDDALCAAILAGTRRPRGHLLPQVMAFHCHSPLSLQTPCARVVRIAVTPALQGKGWGGRLLDLVEADLSDMNIQVLGSSFALEAPVLRFWRRHGLQVLRIGATRESASGLPSCLVAKALPAASASVAAEIDALHIQFCVESRRTCPESVAAGATCRHDSLPDVALPAWRLQARIARFVAGALPFESALGALWRAWPGLPAVHNACGQERTESDASLRALNDLVEGRIGLAEYACHAGLRGREEAITAVRRIFAVLHETEVLNWRS